MHLTDAGPRLYVKATAAATLSYQPLIDRAARVCRLLVDNVSGNDTWVVSVNSREIFRVPINTVGNQQFLGALESATPKINDLFAWYERAFGQSLYVQVPLGMTFTVASVAGATANIVISYEEFSPQDLSPSQVNHPNGNHFVVPVFGNRAAAIAAAGEVALDTQVAPVWMPPIFTPGEVPAGFQIQVLALFLEAGGVNTFSGAANHQSVTDHLAFLLNGQRMFTRAAADGIPIVGVGAAAGSANTVFNGVQTVHPAFQFVEYDSRTLLEMPLRLPPGTTPQWFLGVTGDVTGGADYSKFIMAALVDIVQVSVNLFGA